VSTRYDAINAALERLSGFAYLDAPGFATHGPMGAETLSTLGYHDLVPGWADEYAQRHEPLEAPAAGNPINLADLAARTSALGDLARVTDWAVAFRRQLTEMPWQVVLKGWLPELLPGYAGALTHGLIRTAHAIRALPAFETPSELMLDEVAHGLALWAASYKTLPGRPRLIGQLGVGPAVRRLPRPETTWPILEAGNFARIHEVADFPVAIEALGLVDPPTALSALSAEFCRTILAYPDVFPVPLVHTVTPIAAIRALQPHLPDSSLLDLAAHVWHVGAAVTIAFTPTSAAAAGPTEAEPGPVEELLARAVEHRDPHVLKFTEACVREYAINPEPVYLAAAAHVARRLPAWRQ
jgi:hypothetical protein